MNKAFTNSCIGLIFLWGLFSCTPPAKEIITDINLDPNSAWFKKIQTFQDEQLIDSLYNYFRSKDPSQRFLAARAFGSIKKPEAIDSLSLLLSDPVDQVRAAAAFAIGQTGAETAAEKLAAAFERGPEAASHLLSNRAILEAIGRCGDETYLEFLSTISTYRPSDTLLLEGQAWGIYRFGLRDKINEKGTARMIDYVTEKDYPNEVRLIAANYLFRMKSVLLDSIQVDRIGDVLLSDSSSYIRMTLASAIGRSPSNKCLSYLRESYQKEKDYRVKCNIIRAMGGFEYALAKDLMQSALGDDNKHVSKCAAQFFIDHGMPDEATAYWQWAKDTFPWQVQLGLYRAVNRHLPIYYADYRDAINNELRLRAKNAGSVYERVAAIEALSEFGWNYRYIFREGFQADAPTIRGASIQALADISNKEGFATFFSGSSRYVRKELCAMFQQAIQSGDPGMIAIAAGAIREKSDIYKQHIDTLAPFEIALQSLELPKEIETYNELNKTIAVLKGQPLPEDTKPTYNHPIDWEKIKPNRKAVLRTDQGNIEIEFFPTEAPGSVANFIALTQQGFFNGKVFHRVVSNFVIQGGCPRGDGFGSLDYSIRSELTDRHYDQEGYIGMASAGNHTECTQFFITHSPTPHLDGNYTIFAKVSRGIEVVHRIQQGDKIQEVVLNN
ncbi:MAG TPA: peptidylprolyl isomerase [Saprospiraceae bacterium]|nr:peptidylprolyl isomerase [Saprospiraceae bacterium]HMQ84458.1 peptidylprolyl isomerase [Saprospiraceae bacterium]